MVGWLVKYVSLEDEHVERVRQRCMKFEPPRASGEQCVVNKERSWLFGV